MVEGFKGKRVSSYSRGIFENLLCFSIVEASALVIGGFRIYGVMVANRNFVA